MIKVLPIPVGPLYAAALLVAERDQGRSEAGRERQGDITITSQRNRYRPLAIQRRALDLMTVLIRITGIIGHIADIFLSF